MILPIQHENMSARRWPIVYVFATFPVKAPIPCGLYRKTSSPEPLSSQQSITAMELGVPVYLPVWS